MSEVKDDEGGILLSARIPKHLIALVCSSLFFGGATLWSWVSPALETKSFEDCHSDAAAARAAAERAGVVAETLVRTFEGSTRQVHEIAARLALAEGKTEALRIDLLERTTERFTQTEQKEHVAEIEGKIRGLERHDDQTDRSITLIEKRLDEVLKNMGL